MTQRGTLDEADFGVIIRILCGEPGPWRFATVITVALSRARVTAHFFAKKKDSCFCVPRFSHCNYDFLDVGGRE